MTDFIFNSDEKDDIFFITQAQDTISQAFKLGKIDIRIKDPDGICIYRPSYLCFTTSGEITIVANGDSAEYI